MDLGIATLVIGGVIGTALGAFGVKMLVTGIAPASTARAFRTVKDAGLYHLLFGVALVTLVLGTELAGVAGSIAAAVAVAMAVVAVIRYRPRGGRTEREQR